LVLGLGLVERFLIGVGKSFELRGSDRVTLRESDAGSPVPNVLARTVGILYAVFTVKYRWTVSVIKSSSSARLSTFSTYARDGSSSPRSDDPSESRFRFLRPFDEDPLLLASK
jgi:hypothetical protein